MTSHANQELKSLSASCQRLECMFFMMALSVSSHVNSFCEGLEKSKRNRGSYFRTLFVHFDVARYKAQPGNNKQDWTTDWTWIGLRRNFWRLFLFFLELLLSSQGQCVLGVDKLLQIAVAGS